MGRLFVPRENTMLRTLAATLVAHVSMIVCAQDTGYELLFTSNNQSIPRQCVNVTFLPAGADGTYVLGSMGQFEGADGKEFQNVLDAFGKLHRVDLVKKNGHADQICIAASMMRTGFWNESIAAGAVGPSLLFSETIPPRPSWPPMRNLNGPNDNVVVNTIRAGSSPELLLTTDQVKMLDADVSNLGTVKNHTFHDNVGKGGGAMHIGALSSAHLLRRSAADMGNNNLTAGHVAMVMDAGMAAAEQESTVEIFVLPDDEPHNRSTLNKYKLPRGYVPYHHSFGLTAT